MKKLLFMSAMKSVVMAFSAMVALAGFAAVEDTSATDYYLLSADADWTDVNSFRIGAKDSTLAVPEALPGSNDKVWVPAGTYNFTYNSAATDNTDQFYVFSHVKSVQFGKDSWVTFNITVNEGETATLNNAIFVEAANYDGSGVGTAHYTRGVVVKKGLGTLIAAGQKIHPSWRSDTANFWSYYCSWKVEAGAIKLRPPFVATTDRSIIYTGRINVSEGASFYTSGSEDYIHTLCVRGFEGAGTIISEYSKMATFQLLNIVPKTEKCLFSGNIVGNLNLNMAGPVSFLNPAMDYEGQLYVAMTGNNTADENGVVKLANFGTVGSPSATGKGVTIWMLASGGTIKYLGESGNEVTDKGFYFYGNESDKQGIAHFDAGETGGVTFNGIWTGAKSVNARLVLEGENTMPMKVKAAVKGWTDNGARSINILKKGSGTWSFSDGAKESTNGGTWEIVDGKIQFESIAATGVASALGKSDNLEEFVETVDTRAATHPAADYAIALGDKNVATANPVLEYTGENCGVSMDRKIVVQGRGTLSSGETGSLHLSGVTSRKADSVNTLVLDGASPLNMINNVEGGNGTLNIVKQGAGTWRLGQKVNIGKIEVKAGKLIIDNKPDYEFFRFTIQGKRGSGGSVYPHITQFGLFDADGNCQTHNMFCRFPNGTTNCPPTSADGLTLVSSYVPRQVYDSGYYNLEPNEAAYDKNVSRAEFYAGGSSTDYRGLACIFDDQTKPKFVNENGELKFTHTTGLYLTTIGGSSIGGMTYDPPNRWYGFVMRKAEGTPQIRGFDFVNYGGDHNRDLTHFKMEGSVDGVNFDPLYQYANTEEVFTDSKNRWYGGDHAEYKAKTNQNRKDQMFAIDGAPESSPTAVIGGEVKLSGGTLQVNGTALTVSKLVIDATQGGTLTNVTYASAGTLDITNLPSGKETTVAGSVAGLNLTNWTVTRDGKATVCNVSVNGDGKLVVKRPGIIIMFN